jgi:hypothetical protein
MNVHWRKSTNESEGKREQKFGAAFETIFRIRKCFQGNQQEPDIYFSLEQSRLNILNPIAHVQKVLMYMYRPLILYELQIPWGIKTPWDVLGPGIVYLLNYGRIQYAVLKGQCHEILASFFYESSSPKLLKLGSFSKIQGATPVATGVNDIDGKFAAGVINLPPASTSLTANSPLLSGDTGSAP